MCDYSLMSVPNRLAEEGDFLQIYTFPSGSRGLVATQSVHRNFWQQIKDLFSTKPQPVPCAVCVPPGTRLTLYNISDAIQRQFHVGDTERVTFTQLHAEADHHRDAIRFHNGQTLSLQRLLPGQKIDVLQVSLEEEDEFYTPIAATQFYEMVGT